MPVNLLVLALSVIVLCPLALVLYLNYDVGGADAKAIMVASMLYPETISIFLVGTGIGMLPWYLLEKDEIPALVAFAVGAVFATTVSML